MGLTKWIQNILFSLLHKLREREQMKWDKGTGKIGLVLKVLAKSLTEDIK